MTRLGAEQASAISADPAGNIYASVTVPLVLSPPLLNPIYGLFEPVSENPDVEPIVGQVVLGAGASFSFPSIVQVGSSEVGVVLGPIGVTLYNTGTTNIGISGMSASGDFSQTNSCPATLAASASCAASLSFDPTAAGTRSGTLTIFDNSPGNPHTIQLSGIGTAPAATLNPTSLTFGAQVLNTSSASQTVVLSNTGLALLTISQIAASGDFEESNNCGTQLSPSTSCNILVTFTPKGLGTRTGNLTIADNASGSPQTVALTGMGVPNLGLGLPLGGSSSVTVSAGSTASYTLSIGGTGTSGTVALTCTGAPTDATCTVPASENLSATTATTFSVSVKTTARTSASLLQHSSLGWFWATALIGLVVLPGAAGRKGSPLRRLGGLPILLILFVTACGGGGSGSGGGGGGGGSTGTPAGTYTLTVTATMASTTQSTMLTLIVK